MISITCQLVPSSSGKSFCLIEIGSKIYLSFVPEKPVVGKFYFLAKSEGVAIIFDSKDFASTG
jgi:hypothetical protein